jgi:hypothetical protein
MCMKLVFVVLALGYVLHPAVEASNIIWVSEAFGESGDGTPDDQAWVNMLKVKGYTVNYTKGDSPPNGYWRTLDGDKIAALNVLNVVGGKHAFYIGDLAMVVVNEERTELHDYDKFQERLSEFLQNNPDFMGEVSERKIAHGEYTKGLFK